MIPIRLLLLDNQLLLRESVSRLLESEADMVVVVKAESVVEAAEALREQEVDVAIMGADLACAAGAALAAARPGLRFLALAQDTDTALARAALRAGASGVALRHTTVAALLRAIRQVAAGDVWLDPKLIAALLDGEPAGGRRTVSDGMTAREKNVLEALVEGLPNRAIGERLGISEGAVKAALHRIFRREGLRTRGQLVRRAMEDGRSSQ